MARGFELIKTSILTTGQRTQITRYLEDIKMGVFKPMSPTLRQLRFRSRGIKFEEIIEDITLIKTLTTLNLLRNRKLNLDQMVADLMLLKTLANINVPKGRIGRNLRAQFTILQKSVQAAEISAGFEITQRQVKSVELVDTSPDGTQTYRVTYDPHAPS